VRKNINNNNCKFSQNVALEFMKTSEKFTACLSRWQICWHVLEFCGTRLWQMLVLRHSLAKPND